MVKVVEWEIMDKRDNIILKVNHLLEMLALFLKRMEEKDARYVSRFDKMEEYAKVVAQQINNLEFQVGELVTTVGHMQNKGKFPSATEPNPIEHCKVVELRSRKRYDGPSMPKEVDKEDEIVEQDIDVDEDQHDKKESPEEIVEEDEEEKGME
ncbi:hypothetical protein ACS0TY_034122 [Phlomoides rotata]